MHKKEIFRHLDKKYNNHLYTGLQGFFMNYGHKKLENFKKNNSHFNKVLEIGAGDTPHFRFIKHTYNEYHIAETSHYASDYYKDNSKVKIIRYDGKNLPFDNEYFDRIIISHCLEHILSPEEFILEMIRTLKKGGVLSISLPADPGLGWRIGRMFVGFFKAKRTYDMDFEKYEYLNATEHVNSIFNLRSIIRYNYKNSFEEYFYPLRIKSLDINLIYNVHIYK